MAVKLIAATTGAGQLQGASAQDVISYAARVSNPNNQMRFDTADRLLQYCIRKGHWSVFETASMTLEVTTTRAIADQMLRHRTFTFQQASQRFMQDCGAELCAARRQDISNRQNSIDDLDADTKLWFADKQAEIVALCQRSYTEAIARGIARECARFCLPLSATTTLYMTGNCRSWIHYIQVRTGEGTQAEHAAIAVEAREAFCEVFPNVAQALGWHPA